MNRLTLAWIAFAIGTLFMLIDIIRLNMTGLGVLGTVLLVFWVWGIGGFRREFWGLS